MQGRAGSRLCFPTLVLHPLPVGLASSSAAGCAACSSLSALRPVPGTSRQCRCPPLAWGVQTRLLGLSGTAKSLPPPLVLPADPACHGHHAAHTGPQHSCLQTQQGAAADPAGLARAKRGVGRGCSSAWREESVHRQSPSQCQAQTTLQGGFPPPLAEPGAAQWALLEPSVTCLQVSLPPTQASCVPLPQRRRVSFPRFEQGRGLRGPEHPAWGVCP